MLSRDSPNGSKPNSLPWTTSACVRPAMSSAGAALRSWRKRSRRPTGLDSYAKMRAMIETFVDLTYRGLPLGRRVKLAQVRPTTAYLELASPMPVGTAIGILTDDTVALDAQVIEVHEVASAEHAPGMIVRPKLVGEAAKAWWEARVALPELPPAKPVAL